MTPVTNGAARYMIQEMGIVAVVILLISNAWLLISNINIHNSEGDRLKRIEETRFTSEDGKEMQVTMDRVRESLKRLEEKCSNPQGE